MDETSARGLLRAIAGTLVLAWFVAGCGGPDSAPPPAEPQAQRPQRGVFSELEAAAVRLSPDGRRIAFVASAAGGERPWLAPAEDLAAAERLEGAGDRPVDAIHWSYSGRYLLYRESPAGEEAGRLWAWNVDRSRGRPMTPEGRRAEVVHLSPAHPSTAVVALADAQAGEAKGRDLYRLDLRDGDLDLIAEDERFSAWAIDDDLDLRLAFEPLPEGGLRVRKKAETGEWADFSWMPDADPAKARFLGFDANALRAYFLDGRGRDRVALVESDLVTGAARVLYQDPTADVVDILMHPVKRTIQAAASARPERRWRVLDEAVREDLERLAGLAPGDLEIIDRSLDDTVWLAAITPFDAPRRFYRYDRTTGEADLLFQGLPPGTTESDTPTLENAAANEGDAAD